MSISYFVGGLGEPGESEKEGRERDTLSPVLSAEVQEETASSPSQADVVAPLLGHWDHTRMGSMLLPRAGPAPPASDEIELQGCSLALRVCLHFGVSLLAFLVLLWSSFSQPTGVH